MRYRITPRLPNPISEVGYGMWGMGGWSGADDVESARALDSAVERGCNFFDTAWAYGDGHSERLLGALLRRHPGSELMVASKVPPKNRIWPGHSSMSAQDVFRTSTSSPTRKRHSATSGSTSSTFSNCTYGTTAGRMPTAGVKQSATSSARGRFARSASA